MQKMKKIFPLSGFFYFVYIVAVMKVCMSRTCLILSNAISFYIAIALSAVMCVGNNCPQRIVSLSPVITEELYLLGVGDRIVADTIYCNKPPEAAKKEKVGNVMEVNIEKIISLKPDLVLTSSLTDRRQIEKMEKLGLKVVVGFTAPKSFAQICEEFIKVGEIVGKKKEALRIVSYARRKAADIQGKVKKFSSGQKVVVQIGAKPLWVAPKNSFVNELIEFAGGVNIGPPGESGLYSREKILEENPDIIIITTMGIMAEEEKKNWERYRTINAVKNGRIYIIDSYKLCSPTPVSFVSTLEELVKIIHPEFSENKKNKKNDKFK